MHFFNLAFVQSGKVFFVLESNERNRLFDQYYIIFQQFPLLLHCQGRVNNNLSLFTATGISNLHLYFLWQIILAAKRITDPCLPQSNIFPPGRLILAHGAEWTAFPNTKTKKWN